MHVYLYIHYKYTQYTHILCKQKLLFWMQLIYIYMFLLGLSIDKGNNILYVCIYTHKY